MIRQAGGRPQGRIEMRKRRSWKARWFAAATFVVATILAVRWEGGDLWKPPPPVDHSGHFLGPRGPASVMGYAWRWAEKVVPFGVMWSVALVPFGLNRAHPSRSARRPGSAACFSTCLAILSASANRLALSAFAEPHRPF